MKSEQLLVRCLAQRKGDLWEAFSIDFGLAAQADTLEEARQKLESQIFDYLHGIFCGDDRAFAEQLLTRKAPLPIRIKYAFAWLTSAWQRYFCRVRTDPGVTCG